MPPTRPNRGIKSEWHEGKDALVTQTLNESLRAGAVHGAFTNVKEDVTCMPPKAKPVRKAARLRSCSPENALSTAQAAAIADNSTRPAVLDTPYDFISLSGITLRQEQMHAS